MTFATIRFFLKKSVGRAVTRFAGSALFALGAASVVVLLAGCESVPRSTERKGEPGVATRVSSPTTSAASHNPAMEGPVTATQAQPADDAEKIAEAVTIREGDVLKISFPGAPRLDTSQQVRTDGVVTLDVLGEVKVTGQSPKELEKTLAQMFSAQLVSNEVSVAILSSSFDVYVTGSVLRPGKIIATKPITAFQAIMEAGYDTINSNLEKVMLIRQVGRAKYSYIPLNLQLVLEGKETVPFYLKPMDTLQVPKKISIF